MIQRSKSFALALLGAVFVAGGAAGWVAHDAADGGKRRHGRRDVDALMTTLTHELDLSPTQRDSVRAVLDRRGAETRALWETTHPQYDRIREATQAEIESFLTPDQAARHRELVAEWDRRHRRADGPERGPR